MAGGAATPAATTAPAVAAPAVKQVERRGKEVLVAWPAAGATSATSRQSKAKARRFVGGIMSCVCVFEMPAQHKEE